MIEQNRRQVDIGLAEEIGLAEAMILNQVHYWLGRKNGGKFHVGKKWIYNTFEDWGVQFPCWSRSKIIRIMFHLIDLGLIYSEDLNKHKNKHTRWYSINYNHSLLSSHNYVAPWGPAVSERNSESTKTKRRECQNDTPRVSNCDEHSTKNTTENSSDITHKRKSSEVRSESKQACVNNQSENIEVWLKDQSEDMIKYIEEWVEGQIKKREGTRSQVRNLHAFRTTLIKEVKKGTAREFHYTSEEDQMKILRGTGGIFAMMTDDQLRAELRG